MVLTEVHLLESRVHHALVNLPKSKVSLYSPPFARPCVSIDC